MHIAARLRLFRESKQLSQGDIEKRSGLLRCYISRVENGHTVPSLETLEKMARALDVPLYQLFYDGQTLDRPEPATNGEGDWASRGRGSRLFNKLKDALGHLSSKDRAVLLFTATKMVNIKKRNRV